MGKVLQKKKARSGRSKARAKDNRLKSGHKKINVLGNQIIADNWYAAAIVLLTANRN
jgi:nucleolar protein 16